MCEYIWIDFIILVNEKKDIQNLLQIIMISK